MANTVTVRKLHDGTRYVNILVTLVSDGSGDVVNFPILEGSQFALETIKPSLSGFDVALSFDALVDVPAWVCTPENKPFDFRKSGGIKDPLAEGYTKKVLLSTSGFTASGDRGSLLIQARKS